MSGPVFVYTQHAHDNMVARGIVDAFVERTILSPEATEPDPRHSDRVRPSLTLPEYDGRCSGWFMSKTRA